jgi:predicted dehydrogenase
MTVRLTSRDRAPYHREQTASGNDDKADDHRMHFDAHDDREILIAGLGSVGRRHLSNLRALGWTRIRLYRTGRSTLPDESLAAYPVDRDLSAALARRPRAVIVANPSALHVPLALAAARAGAHLLIEKPLSHDLAGITELDEAIAVRGLTALVGFQLRFNPGLRQIKAWLDEGAIGTVISAQVHWGEHLPGMHPWEDYRVGYAARPDLGGGVLLTLCHPFDYLRWLLGEIDDVTAIESIHDPLRLAVETCVDVNLRFASGASGHVHLDFVQQPPEHRLTIIGTAGTLTWSHDDHAARRYSGASRQWETVAAPEGFERNHMFFDEMRHFLACVSGEARPLCTVRDGIAALTITLAAKRALARQAPRVMTASAAGAMA